MATETLEPHLVDSLRKSAWEIFDSMVFMTPSSIEAHPDDATTFDEEVIGILGFTGTRSGTFVIRTHLRTAEMMTAKMLMVEVSELDGLTEVSDAYGEIVNMLCGNFKNAWVANGNQMELSVPNVIAGGQVTVSSSSTECLHSVVRVQLDDEDVVDIGVYFEAQN